MTEYTFILAHMIEKFKRRTTTFSLIASPVSMRPLILQTSAALTGNESRNNPSAQKTLYCFCALHEIARLHPFYSSILLELIFHRNPHGCTKNQAKEISYSLLMRVILLPFLPAFLPAFLFLPQASVFELPLRKLRSQWKRLTQHVFSFPPSASPQTAATAAKNSSPTHGNVPAQ